LHRTPPLGILSLPRSYPRTGTGQRTRTMEKRSWKNIAVNLALFVITTSIMLGICEGVLRYLYPDPTGFFLHTPYDSRVYHANSETLPGVNGPSYFTINSKGVRGDELTPDYTYRIMALGGSTTECLYLDQSKAWPNLLQTKLNEGQDRHKVWGGNFGKTGVSTREHRFQVPRLLSDFRDIDAALFLFGVNDALIRLARWQFYDPEYAEKPENLDNLLYRSYAVVPKNEETVESESSRFKTIELTQSFFQPPPTGHIDDVKPIHIEDEAGTVYIPRREYRKTAKAIWDETPDLESCLLEYERNIQVCIEAARRRSVRIVFLTQPVLWDPDLPEELRDLLWTGGVGSIAGEGLDYYSVRVLAEVMEAYNNKLKEIAEKEGLEIVDLASMLPKDTGIFYDDCHFNDNGSWIVSEIIAQYLLERPPFSE
jgi:hypothetical protein